MRFPFCGTRSSVAERLRIGRKHPNGDRSAYESGFEVGNELNLSRSVTCDKKALPGG
jgi:hypothetical protein